MAKWTKVHPRLRGNKLVNRYIFQEGSCVIPKKTAYMYDETWEKVVNVVSPGIIKIKVSSFACVLPILLSIYLTLHICPSKLFTDYMCFL